MSQSYFWNDQQEYHPKNRLCKYSKSSKISPDTLRILAHLRKIYKQLPSIVYCQRNRDESNDAEIVINYDIFNQPCQLSSNNEKTLWQPTSFYVTDTIYQQMKNDLLRSTIDPDSIYFSLFPIYVDIPHEKSLNQIQGIEEIYFPSMIPSTGHDLLQLQQRFDLMLHKEEALEIGLCPIRRRLYDDLFDELIRLTTLQCLERGFLLARIKNEHVRWMNTYEELYTSGMAFALRLFLYKTEEKQKEEHTIEQLEEDCARLREQIENESNRLEKYSLLLNNRELDKDDEETFEKKLLRNNVTILRSSNEILRRDLQETLNNILLSNLFLGEPIKYDKDID